MLNTYCTRNTIDEGIPIHDTTSHLYNNVLLEFVCTNVCFILKNHDGIDCYLGVFCGFFYGTTKKSSRFTYGGGNLIFTTKFRY